jgi:UDP-4-amino-4,6-dideoxy-N-acetyl-beta-L-altrosamine transaminase
MARHIDNDEIRAKGCLMHNDTLPYGRHSVEDDDVAAVAAALKSDYLTTGALVERFEKAFCVACGGRHAVACNSGTAALHLACLALDIGPEQTAIVPTMTFLATANAVRMTGAEVVFADVDPETGLLTPQTLDAALRRAHASGLSVTAGFPVHLNGQFCDMASIAAVADQYRIGLVEDACHALGEINAGGARLSRAACFSTHPVKAITTGEGGVVVTTDAGLAARMRRLRSHGMVHEAALFEDRSLPDQAETPWSYQMLEIGWNYRIPDILCALGLSQLRKLSQFMARRRAIAALYDCLLAPLAPVIKPVPHGTALHGWHLYVLLIDFRTLGLARAKVMKLLYDQGVGTQIHYIPVHRQPYYRRRYGSIVLPGAEAYYSRCLSIPFFPAMTDDDVHRVAEAFGRIASKAAA